MVIVAGVAAAIVILALGLLFFRASGRRESSAVSTPTQDPEHRGTGIN